MSSWSNVRIGGTMILITVIVVSGMLTYITHAWLHLPFAFAATYLAVGMMPGALAAATIDWPEGRKWTMVLVVQTLAIFGAIDVRTSMIFFDESMNLLWDELSFPMQAFIALSPLASSFATSLLLALWIPEPHNE